MNNPYHISVSIATIFWVKMLKFFDADTDSGSGIFLTLDPGSGMEKNRIRDKKNPESATLDADQHPGPGMSNLCGSIWFQIRIV
jgi:hypothetical protein